MGRFRNELRAARRVLHDYMADSALYFAWPFGATVPRKITVRVHERYLPQGDLAGTNFHYAERRDDSPRAIFMLEEIKPAKGFYIAVESTGVVYRLDASDPPDDLSQTFSLARLSPSESKLMPRLPSYFTGGAITFPTFGG